MALKSAAHFAGVKGERANGIRRLGVFAVAVFAAAVVVLQLPYARLAW
jgi:hypothetical protein